MNENGQYYVEALGRGLAILDCFVEGPSQLSLTELCARVQLNRGTTFRLLRTLEQSGYLSQDQVTKKYRLTVKVLDLQQAALNALDVARHALPSMERLNEQVEESVSVAVLERREIRYIARVPARRIMSINLEVGSKLPAHATSMGKVLLSGLSADELKEMYGSGEMAPFTKNTITQLGALQESLEQVRADGFALADEELELGLRSVSAPIRDHNATIIAAMNVSASTARISVDELRDNIAPLLIAAANEISVRIGYREPESVSSTE